MKKSDNNRDNLDFIKNGEVFMPLFTGRPKREISISKDEITNLVIALGTCIDVSEFINLM